MAPNEREIHHRHLGQPRPGRCGRGRRRRQNAFDVGFDVLVRDAALGAGAVDAAQVGAQLAREFAHRGTGVGLRKSLLVDLGDGARGGRRRSGGRRRRRCGRWLGGRRVARRRAVPRDGCRGGRVPPVRAAAGAGAAEALGAAAADAGAVAGCAAGDSPAAAAGSINRISDPSETLSPCLSLTCVMRPAIGAGTSIAAFSVSSVISGASLSICWPSLTMTSMTLTSLKPPMSGTRTSMGVVTAAPRPTEDWVFPGRCRRLAWRRSPSACRSCRRRRAP